MKDKKLAEEKITPTPSPTPEIGIDTQDTFVNNIIAGAQLGTLDVSSIDALTNSAQTREQIYELLDSMSRDDVISAVLDTYVEDTIQTNDKGQKIWVESSDPAVLNYTTWLMDSLNIDKSLDAWVYCLVTYGDVYVRLYRKSDYTNDLLFQNNKHNKQLNEAFNKDSDVAEKAALTEDTVLRVYTEDDPYVPYVEMVPNPGEMFDLQKFGKTHGYIKAPTRVIQQYTDELYTYLTRYKMKQKDVEIFDATSFVHACLETTTQRQPETVDIFLDNHADKVKETSLKDNVKEETNDSDSMTTSYSVKRGQSILYNSFRIWRELNLLEMSALLNRITQSSVVRCINIDTGDMPKEQVQIYLQRLKEKIEQKSALNVDTSMGEYNNPGPIINTIYIPTHNGQGAISVQNIGGDFDPKALTDIEYFRDKLFGSLKTLKQYFGFTEDGAGFNGGTSLTILSSRYGKAIKKIQSKMCQLVTDIINLFLINRGLVNYVNKFTIKMQAPVTQEELDRRTNTDNRIRYVGDIMQQLTDVEDKPIRLKIFKSLLSDVINDPEVINYLQQYIDDLEKPAKNDTEAANTETGEAEQENLDLAASMEESAEEKENKDVLLEDSDNDETLPSPEALNFDAVNNKKGN